jgi:aryl-alcohol dehydrogenase-like predicted oxidoreductase
MNTLLNKIAIGSAQFGLDYGISNKTGKVPYNEVEKIFQVLSDRKINTVDTASLYGTSEEVLGSLDIKKFNIISKFKNVKSNLDVEIQLRQSLEKLNVSSLYGYLSHSPFNVIQNPEIWEYLIELKLNKIVEKIGFSFNTLSELEKVIEFGFIPDLIQVPYNYLDRSYEKYMKEFKDRYNTEIHTRSTFLQGLLLMDPKSLPTFFDPIKDILSTFSIDKIRAQLIQFVIEKSFVDKVIIGVTSREELVDNLKMIEENVSPLPSFDKVIPMEILTPLYWPK